jgi:acetyl-CoA carboxylase biotin carboxyl carrier protein
MAQKNSDLQKINELIEIMKVNDLVEVEIKHGDDKISLKRRQSQQPVVPAGTDATQISAPEAAAPDQVQKDNLVVIKSPIVGTFYATPSPDSDPFVEVGSQVNPQTVVCIVEAMKVMNEIKAETSGTIAEILVSNGQAVEYGQELFKVKPD